jgi:hypothetical protein
MNDKNRNMPANASHLGIRRDTSSKFGVKLVVPDRIQTARKTVYALMGAGLHGMNGINPMVSIHMIKCFVLPRLLYGLDGFIPDLQHTGFLVINNVSVFVSMIHLYV